MKIPLGIMAFVLTLAGNAPIAVAQQPHKFGWPATVSRSGTTVTITADGPRPMRDAVRALSIEYGWTIDYEDPVYRLGPDTRDATSPTGPRGGQLAVTFKENTHPGLGTQPDVAILNSFVAAYNGDHLPGTFALVNEDPTHISVVGTSDAIPGGTDSLLGTPITLSQQTVDAASAIAEILTEVSKTTGIKSVLATAPPFLLSKTHIKADGNSRPARAELRRVLDSTGVALFWSLLYDTDDGTYHFNILPVTIKTTDAAGNQFLIPVSPR